MRYGTPIKNYLEHVGSIEREGSHPARFQWEYVYDLVTLTETEDGVEVQIDTIL